MIDDEFEFKLISEDAYGTFSEEAVVAVPMKAFEVDGKVDEYLLQVGNTIPMLDTSGGRMNGIVLEKSIESVKMDFNHPLAGNDLTFKGAVVDIREATADEIDSPRRKLRGIIDPLYKFLIALANPAASYGECTRRIQHGHVHSAESCHNCEDPDCSHKE